MQYIIISFVVFFLLRLLSLSFSIRNEKALIKKGAVQYGRLNSLLLTLAHVALYGFSLLEAYLSDVKFDKISLLGLVIMLFSYGVLFYVIYKLRDVWTVKLYILPEHRIERSFLFRVVRHPNYFLNIIPELIGLVLLCHAWMTCCIGLPIYLLILFVRIRQEEEAMKDLWTRG